MYIMCQNVSFSYEGKVIIDKLNFNVDKGDYICVLGENGAGKSTLVKGLLGLKKPSMGKILFGDELKPNEIGYLPQQTDVQKDFPASVFEVVLSGRLNSRGLRPFYSKNDKIIANEKIELLGITDLKNSCYRELSGGQKQRVLLARALCAAKKFLLLDEPVTGLDPIMTQELYQLIKNLNEIQKMAIIMVSHDLYGAVENANKILHLGKDETFFGSINDYRNSSLGKKFLANGGGFGV